VICLCVLSIQDIMVTEQFSTIPEPCVGQSSVICLCVLSIQDIMVTEQFSTIPEPFCFIKYLTLPKQITERKKTVMNSNIK